MVCDRNGVELQVGDKVAIFAHVREIGHDDEIVVEPIGDEEIEYDRIECSPAMTDKVQPN